MRMSRNSHMLPQFVFADMLQALFVSREGNLEFDFNERTFDKMVEFMKE